MKVYFVGSGPGDPELLTIKAERLLKSCKICVYAGSLVNPEILRSLPESCEKHDSAAMDLPQICDVFVDASKRGLDVVRLHSGDPSIYGAIGEQMRELRKLGIDYEVIPGVSSFQASAAALKTELTAPDVSQTIILTRTAGRTPLPPEQELRELARSRSTLCIFLSADKIRSLATDLEPFYGRDCPVGVVFRASWPDQKIMRGTLESIADIMEESGTRKTAMIIVGRALSEELPSSKLYDPSFSHEFRVGRE
jgi:precorrin-4/cobalt-precorrin-4 C11-methyltransferase